MAANNLQILGRKLGSICPGGRQEGVGVATFQHDGQISCIDFARVAFGSRDVLRGLNDRDACDDVFRGPDLGSPPRLRPGIASSRCIPRINGTGICQPLNRVERAVSAI
jgi:hypothetical protein